MFKTYYLAMFLVALLTLPLATLGYTQGVQPSRCEQCVQAYQACRLALVENDLVPPSTMYPTAEAVSKLPEHREKTKSDGPTAGEGRWRATAEKRRSAGSSASGSDTAMGSANNIKHPSVVLAECERTYSECVSKSKCVNYGTSHK